jgi:UDP-N-acetylmuramate dehydrogenase
MHSSLPLQTDFSLLALNTFGMDVNARGYLAVRSVNDLLAVCADRALFTQPRLILGGGSNLLLLRDFPGLVLHMCIKGRQKSGEDDGHIHVTAAAGEDWHEFVLWTLENGWGGLENLSLVPGTVGAAPVQNIGAYGAELKDCFHSLRAFDFKKEEIRVFDRADCRFGYRESIFRQEGKNRYVILDVTFALPKQWTPNLSYPEVANALAVSGNTAPLPGDISHAIVAIRQRKLPDPAVLGNAGSFFRNPTVPKAVYDELARFHPQMPGYLQPDGNYRIAAGWLIDQCGWKEKASGNVGVYETQALVLVNRGQATGEDIVRLSQAIQQDVKTRFGLWLEPEPEFV